jgi:hypothetical protein
MFSTGLSTQQVNALIQSKLYALRKALEDVQDLQMWAAGISLADVETATGLTEADATTVKSAIADASALGDYYNTGLPPATYPQPSSAYPYGQSQRAVIGPQ